MLLAAQNGFCLTDLVNNHNYLHVSFILARSLSPVFPRTIGFLTSCCVAEHWEFFFRSLSKLVHDRKKISNWLIFNLLNAKLCSAGLCTNGPGLDNSCKALEITEILYCWMMAMITGQKKTSFCQAPQLHILSVCSQNAASRRRTCCLS